MTPLLLFALQAGQPDILVTASLTPVDDGEVGVSSSVLDQERIEALGEVQAIDLIRLLPSASVSMSGARGSQAQVRIRGAEANHTLLFIDGIRFTDPAAGNEARFETLAADGLGAVELVRGPHSALWGSEAIGGVIALSTIDPGFGLRGGATGEYGERGSLRASGALSYGGERGGLSLTASHSGSDGVDIFGGGNGDLDGYDNLTLAAKALLHPVPGGRIGLVARYIDHHAEFDGTDPLTFTRADTRNNSDTRTGAVRMFAQLGERDGPWTLGVEGQYLTSANRNFDAEAPLNQTDGDRFMISGRIERRIGEHSLIALAEREDEHFRARDQQYFGGTNQNRARGRTAFVGEWRGYWGRLQTDIAVRHDDFSAFADETTFRAAALFEAGSGVALHASYGEGIAQPTFYDLFGFFPGSFAGNPSVRPERSTGYEAGVRWRNDRFDVGATWFSAQLGGEIVPTYDPATGISSTANATGISERRGIEIEAEAEPVDGLRLQASYTWLEAEDQQVAGGARLREARRPEHSAALSGDWRSGPVTIGGSLAYVGERVDTDYDLVPAVEVRLGDYVLGSLRASYALAANVEAYARADNLFDAKYEDAVGYATPGRTVYAGIRLRFGD